MMDARRDSVNRIVTVYLALFAVVPFRYSPTAWRGETEEPTTVTPQPCIVSPGILRGFTCPAMCGACCKSFTMDWLPYETMPHNPRRIKLRTFMINGRDVPVFTDAQAGNDTGYCRYLRHEDGRCGIHGTHPMPCDFELIRPLMSHIEARPNRVTTKLFGRGHQLMRVVDQTRGALCTVNGITDDTIDDTIRRLNRLQAWADHCRVITHIPTVVAWAKDPARRTEPLHLAPDPLPPLS